MTLPFPIESRRFNTLAVLSALLIITLFSACSSKTPEEVIVLSPLPFGANALEPVLSAKTLAFHHGKHHAVYVKNAVNLLKQSGLDAQTPEEVIEEAADNKEFKDLFNQAAQAYNHDFFWKCLKPNGGGKPTGLLLEKIISSFGSFDAFKEAFISKAKGLFGSGWVFLVEDDGVLSIMTTANADTPIAHGLNPLFTVDVWEHAYYLDYQNKRSDYVNAVLTKLANWEFAASRLE